MAVARSIPASNSSDLNRLYGRGHREAAWIRGGAEEGFVRYPTLPPLHSDFTLVAYVGIAGQHARMTEANTTPTKHVINETPAAALRERARDNQPVWDAMTKLAAPAALIVSATSYLSGYSYRYTLLTNFGFRPGIVDGSIQDNIAFGYIPLAIVVILFVTLFIILGISQELLNQLGKFRSRDFAKKSSFVLRRPLSYMNIFQFSCILLTIGIFAGWAVGFISSSRIDNRIKHGCFHDCFYYRLSNGRVLGIMLAQSKDMTIIIGRDAAYVLPTSTIKSSRVAKPIYRR